MRTAEGYRKAKEEHRCVFCGKQDSRTLNGLTRCSSCYEKEKIRKRKYENDTYHWRIKNHYCGKCGEKDAFTMNGRSMCSECADKDAERKRKKSGYNQREIIYKSRKRDNILAAERPSFGLCFFCGKPISNILKSDNKEAKTCSECYERCARIGTRNLVKNVQMVVEI